MLIGVSCSISVAGISKEKDAFCETLTEQISEGDIVFLAIDNALYQRVARASGGWVSHVGIVFKNNKKQWEVAESTIPFSKTTPFCKFIKKSAGDKIAIKRLGRQLNAHEIYLLKHESKKRMGILYHLGFKFHSKRQFCSKFVYEVYRDALDEDIGSFQIFEELFENLRSSPHFEPDMKFWKRWYFGSIPMQRETLTPQFQYIDSDLVTVFDNSDTESNH